MSYAPPRKRSRLGPLGALAALALAILGALYARCGSGFGFGPGGDGVGSERGESSAPAASDERLAGRCQLRLAADGLTLDGKPIETTAAVTACQRHDGADLVVTGDARQGDLDALRAELDRAKIPVFSR
jgi:hypothetical protein